MAADWSMLQRGGDLVFKIFFLVSKNNFQPGFSRAEVRDAAFEPKFVKNFKIYKIAKNFSKPSGTKGKVVGKGRVSLVDFLPGVRK